MTLFDTPEQMQALLRRVEILDKKVNAYAGRIRSALRASHTIDSMIGESQGMTAFKSYLLRYARTDAPILILGATGTGKELAASAIHRASARADGPFVSLNCAAIPKELFESEVFGYAPGAFSGAHRDGKIGQIELADRGTLFLDEIGDLPPHAQVKLLRVLEEKGSCGSGLPARARWTSPCRRHQPRPHGHDRGRHVPRGSLLPDQPHDAPSPAACRTRRGYPLLVRDILNRMGAEDIRCTDAALAELARYAWPGNVRELRNVLVRARTLCRDNSIGVADLPPEVLRQNAAAPRLPAGWKPWSRPARRRRSFPRWTLTAGTWSEPPARLASPAPACTRKCASSASTDPPTTTEAPPASASRLSAVFNSIVRQSGHPARHVLKYRQALLYRRTTNTRPGRDTGACFDCPRAATPPARGMILMAYRLLKKNKRDVARKKRTAFQGETNEGRPQTKETPWNSFLPTCLRFLPRAIWPCSFWVPPAVFSSAPCPA